MGRTMEGMYFSTALDDGRTLCLTQMTDRRAAMSVRAIEDTSGYFLYELTGIGDTALVDVIARVDSDDAVLKLSKILNLR